MVICMERGADLHMAQLMPLPLTVSRFCKIQIGFTFLVPAHPGSPGKGAVKRVCVCVSVLMNAPICQTRKCPSTLNVNGLQLFVGGGIVSIYGVLFWWWLNSRLPSKSPVCNAAHRQAARLQPVE